MSDNKKTFTAPVPFDNPDCDIILRSSDGVDFHVFKVILSLVSPVFKDMFTLPPAESDSSVPVISVEETSTTLNSLLLLCYPATTPTFNSLERVEDVVKAATKYDMAVVLTRAADLVMAQFLSTNSLELYALSCRIGWQRHAQEAATQTLKIKELGRPSSAFAGMRSITALDYHKLLVYHHECGVAAQAVVESLIWLKPEPSGMCMWTCTYEAAGRNARKLHIDKHYLGIALWFDEYLVSSGKELLARPCETTLFESETYDQAVGKAVTCTQCLPNVVVHMAKFRTLFAAQVKKVVGNVRLKADGVLMDRIENPYQRFLKR
ncbi:hypothetical protein AZE42_06838 [Rhizopogon vesiculosus]|uniref:BTB domain-containing protein n=1 Tax=Rhizopogon vesiculosus TaxID=180088 RepID=A0A1J8Q5J9_9AGAM|nr:hypothetical protein AZE42_06838 [Rhizopogon vesiculosus]